MSCLWLSIPCNLDLLADGMCGYVLSVYEFRVHYLHIPSEAGLFVAIQTGMADHFWLPKMVSPMNQFWLLNSVPLGPLLARQDQFWQPKAVRGDLFGSHNQSGGPLLGQTDFHMTVPSSSVYNTPIYYVVRSFIIRGRAGVSKADIMFCCGTQTMDNSRICHCLLFHEHGKENFMQPFLQ